MGAGLDSGFKGSGLRILISIICRIMYFYIFRLFLQYLKDLPQLLYVNYTHPHSVCSFNVIDFMFAFKLRCHILSINEDSKSYIGNIFSRSALALSLYLKQWLPGSSV